MKSPLLHTLLLPLLLSANTLFARQQTTWTCGRFQVCISETTISVFDGNAPLVTAATVRFNYALPISIRKTGTSRDTLKLILSYSPEARYRDETGELSAEVEVTVVNNALHFRSSPDWAANVSIQFEDRGEHFFGILEPLFPANRKSPDLRSEVVEVDVVGEASRYHENYASAWSAFFMTSAGYASFFDTFAAGTYRLGINGITELSHRTGRLDWYFIAGRDGDEILRQYYAIIGKPKFVPMWGIGPVGWRDQNNGGKDEILDDLRRMSDLRIPFTAWFVDRPYSNGAHEWSHMDFAEKFADPKKWIHTIRTTYGLELMTWVAPTTFGDTQFPGHLPSQEGYFDLTDPNAVAEFRRRLTTHQYAAGVRGHKIDRADQLFPQMYPWYDGTPVPERRNKYIFLLTTTVDGFLREVYGHDQMNFARAAFHRCQPSLSAVWGGDSRSTWDGLAANLANAIRCGFMGFPVWGSDVGGYMGGRIPEKLYARWLQFGTWSGFYEIKLDGAGGRGENRVPWKYSGQIQNIFRSCNTQRMEMQPYLYSLVNTSYKNGVVMKPLAYAFPGDTSTFHLWDAYMFGGAFLVAPLLDSTDTRSVYLPQGRWYDFHQPGTAFDGGQTLNVTQPIERIPVFVRANAMYVTGVMRDGNSKLWKRTPADRELQIHVFPGNPGDRCSFDYVDIHDGNREKELTVEANEKTIDVVVPALSTRSLVVVRLERQPASVILNSKAVGFSWKEESKTGSVRIQPGAGVRIVIRR